MAKRCDCGAVLAAYETDPRLRTLPLAARALWLELVRAMQRLGGSVLTCGSAPLTRSEIALLIQSDESELQPNLDRLLARGLIVEAADGALSSPLLAGMVNRSEINRINGQAGGAVRRRQAEERRQQSLHLPISGGRGESKPQPKCAPPPDPASLAKKSEAGLADDPNRVGERLLAVAGIERQPGSHFGIVRAWLLAGATEALIGEVITRVMARGARPQGLQYFDKAVREALAEPPRNPAWNAAIERWIAGGQRGAMPKLADFQAAMSETRHGCAA